MSLSDIYLIMIWTQWKGQCGIIIVPILMWVKVESNLKGPSSWQNTLWFFSKCNVIQYFTISNVVSVEFLIFECVKAHDKAHDKATIIKVLQMIYFPTLILIDLSAHKTRCICAMLYSLSHTGPYIMVVTPRFYHTLRPTRGATHITDNHNSNPLCWRYTWARDVLKHDFEPHG